MDKVEQAKIDPNIIPDGFHAAYPDDGIDNAATSEQKQKQQAMEEQRQAILHQALTSDALTRLNRIKLVKEAKAKSLESNIVSMVMSGKLGGQRINEGKLIEMLERGSAREARAAGSINIRRKKYAFDSDEEDDDDV